MHKIKKMQLMAHVMTLVGCYSSYPFRGNFLINVL
jgi:hypothetical protein